MGEILSKSIDENSKLLKKKLRVDENFDVIYRELDAGGRRIGFFFIDGFCKDDLMQKLLQYLIGLKPEDIPDNIDEFSEKCMPHVEVDILYDAESVVSNVLMGVTCFLVDGIEGSVALDTRTYPMRSVDEPWKDRVLRGSRDGFVETIVMNTALIRRRIRDERLRVEMTNVGTRSKTDIAIVYLEDKVDKTFLKNLKKRIDDIKVESLTMNIESFAECLLDAKYINPFPKFKFTERPDTAASAIYEGNIIIIVDNAPSAIILPTSVFDILEEADDYYFPPVIGIYLKMSRYLLTFVSFALTPFWLVLIKNPSMVPDWLSFVLITDEITVPVILQLLMLEIGIDGLKLAAVNTPSMLSTPLSIVAGIVVGEYAVSSGWFNSEALLYMAIVTVANYGQASFEFGYALKIMRIITLILTWFIGIWGFLAGTALLVLSICFNKTLSGKSYIYPIFPFNGRKLVRKLFRIRLPHEN